MSIAIIKWFINSDRELKFPENGIPFKETLMTVLGELYLSTHRDHESIIKGLKLTPTDVLRFAVYLSGGDISLPTVPRATIATKSRSYGRTYRRGFTDTTLKVNNPERDKFKFKRFSRKERRYIMDLLESSNCNAAEMTLKEQRWIKLAHGLHAGEYAKSHPKAFAAINKIRNEKVTSWYGKLELAFKKSLEAGLTVLSERPGEFMRRIDALVRKNQHSAEAIRLIMKHFQEAVNTSSNKVLFEVYGHFENRREAKTGRYIKIKGQRKSTVLPDLPAIKREIIATVQERVFESLQNKFAKLPALGNCYVDEQLKKIPLPSDMRSLDFTLKPTVRGTRIPFDNPNAKVIRPFIHWMDPHGREDLDLSAVFVGKKGVNLISYHSLKVGNSCHSGDVRHRQGACAEYIDIDLKDAIAGGWEYVVVMVHNFNGGTLASVDSMFGLQERQHPESNSHWLPETVSNTVKCESKSSDTLLAILDLNTKEYIFLDVDGNGSRNAINDLKSVRQVIDQYAGKPKISVYDLVMMHVKGRGREVTLDQNVDTYFHFNDFCNDYVKTGELMGI